MDQSASFGYWVRRRRRILDMTQADLANKISCSLSMLRKIERDERRPSDQLASLLADHLAVDEAQRPVFLQIARGHFDPAMPSPTDAGVNILGSQEVFGDQDQDITTFVGRERELSQLHERLTVTLAGQGQMLFIAGEAGQGKTSLLNEFARQAFGSQPELIVAGGRSDVYTGFGDPLKPFRDIFRLLAGDIRHAAISRLITRVLVRRLIQILPQTAEILLTHGPHLIDTLVPGTSLETRLVQSFPEHQRTVELLFRLKDRRRRMVADTQDMQQERLFEEISSTLITLARKYPLLLILDDLHWVDTSTADFLAYLAIHLQNSPILIVGSFRPEDLIQEHAKSWAGQGAQHPLLDILSESRHLFGENRVNLDRQNPENVLRFVNALLDEEPNHLNASFRKQFAHLTEGNALFSVELVREMKERGYLEKDDQGYWIESETLSWEYIPPRVGGILEKRITRLPEDLREVLSAASIQGETFIAEVIAKVKQIENRYLAQLLSANLDRQHRLIHEQGVQYIGSKRASKFRFRHHLFQKYLYERLGAVERMYLHEDVGNALEALYTERAETDDLSAAHLARHFEEAHLPEKAGHYLLLAGQNAARVIAFDEATAHFQRGLFLLSNLTPTPKIKELEFELTLSLARVFWHGGEVAKSVAAFEKAIEIAHDLANPVTLSIAVLSYEELRWRLNLDAESSQQNIREALSVLGEEESGLRVRLLVNLARALLAFGERAELRATVDEALEIARRIDDKVALCDALRIYAQIDRRPETTFGRWSAVEEMRAIAIEIGDQERLSDALDLFIYDQLELGNIDLVDETIADQKQIAEEIKQPFQLHIAAVFQTMRAIMYGDFYQAERLANKAADISRQIGLADLDGILGIHMFTIRREQGRLKEIEPIVKLYVAGNPASASWRPGLALIYALLGERSLCRAVFEELAANTFAFVPRDSMWVTSLAYLTEVCAYLGDEQRAAMLYELLMPYDGRAVVVGGATACYGAAARYLGLLARIMGNWNAAQRHFEGALELDTRMGAWPWLAHTQYEYAAMLLARGEAIDHRQALALLDKAAAVAQEKGMVYLLQKVKSLHEKYEYVK